MILRTFLTIALAVSPYSPVFGQASRPRPPVIDVHLHAPLRAGPVEDFTPRLETILADIERLNVRRVVLNGLPDVLFAWRGAIGADRTIPSLLFPCENGVAVNWGRPCFEDGADWPEIGQLREYIEAGHVQALGEITTQYLGLGPSDPALEPYFALAEEYDLPVFIHMGPGPRFSAYDENEFLVKAPNYRAAPGRGAPPASQCPGRRHALGMAPRRRNDLHALPAPSGLRRGRYPAIHPVFPTALVLFLPSTPRGGRLQRPHTLRLGC
jgi:hypothetical protein